jgi:hypothetical protein
MDKSNKVMSDEEISEAIKNDPNFAAFYFGSGDDGGYARKSGPQVPLGTIKKIKSVTLKNSSHEKS